MPCEAVVRQAIEWSLRLQVHPCDTALYEQCQRWRTHAAEHERAWQQVQALTGELSQQFAALPASGLAIEALEQSQQRLHRRQALKLLSSVAVVGSAAWFARDVAPMQQWRADYATGIAQRGSFHLADGTSLQLNTDSAVNHAVGEGRRSITLTRGEILLDTATSQPGEGRSLLQVHSGHGVFETLAGRFVVRRDERQTRLSVIAGEVLVRPMKGQPVQARAGQDYRVSAIQAHLVPDPDMDASAWIDGLIVTRGMRLRDFLAEVARYRRGRVACSDDIADLRLSGVFRLQDTDKLLAVLPRTLPVQVDYRTRWWVTLRRQA
ncbi:peptide ABC transporter substrate-binding protein [Pseudomonas cremoricolorata]|uniref:Peptide ABC transporter substrate-binding protein n=1 Tax=Pseudomonas cremoricolorata TaxID=157783 RepID=A0A089WJB9_9PSED|nr:peptide ABC transporter substrate-binding protein [Pseudomonas cremoricolorata]